MTLQNLALENMEVFMQSPLSLFTGGQTEKVGTLMIAFRFTKDWAVLSANPPSSAGLGANDQNLLQRAPFHNAFIDLALRIRAGSSSCDQRSRIASPDHPIRLNSSSAAGARIPKEKNSQLTWIWVSFGQNIFKVGVVSV